MSDRRTVEDAVAAGGVVYRRHNDRVEVVLVSRTRSGLWALPKGRPEPGETLEQTALREVAEETGLEVAIVGEVGSDRYSFTHPSRAVRIEKRVQHYLMEPRGGDLSLHDEEYDVARWLDVNEACRLLTFPSQRAIVERAALLIERRVIERRVIERRVIERRAQP